MHAVCYVCGPRCISGQSYRGKGWSRRGPVPGEEGVTSLLTNPASALHPPAQGRRDRLSRGDDDDAAHGAPLLVRRSRSLYASVVRVRDGLDGLPGGVVHLHHVGPRPLHARAVAAWIQTLGEKLVILAAQPVGAVGPHSGLRHLPLLPRDSQRADVAFDQHGESINDGELKL